MKFLKVLLNSIVCGVFFSILMALLIYDLNINLPFNFLFFVQITLFLSLTYGILIILACIVTFFIVQFFSVKKINIAFVSPSFLIPGFSFLILLYLIIYKINYDHFLTFFDSVRRDLLNTQAWALVFLAAAGLLIMYAIFLYRKRLILFTSYFVIFALLMTLAVTRRTSFPSFQEQDEVTNLESKEIDKKITIIGLDGLSFDFLIPLINEEKLNNFSLLMREGCWGQMQSFSPSKPIILNSSFNTGKWPSKHRQLSLYSYQLFNITREIEVVPRFIFFRQLTRIGLLLLRPNQPGFFTKDFWSILDGNGISYLKRDWPLKQEIESPRDNTKTQFDLLFEDLKFETEDIFRIARNAFYADSEYEDDFNTERKETLPEIVYLRLNGLNIAETYFYKYSFPNLFGDIDQEDISKYGTVIERYYRFYDNIIGKYISTLKENELLVVYSPHGIEPLPLWKRFVEALLGNSEVGAYHDQAPEGAIFFYGKEVARGTNIEGIEIIDIAPTLLYYLGLQVGMDMDGVALPRIFQDEFREEHPVLYIESYDKHIIKEQDGGETE